MKRLYEKKIIAIVRNVAPEKLLPLAHALYAGGISMLEVPFAQNDSEGIRHTAEAIRTLTEKTAGKMEIGAGTVLSREQLFAAADAGASYVISPNVNGELIAETKRLGLLSFPGALTPTEIVRAWNAGADAVKVFPAGNMGTAYFQALRAPLSHIPMIAVGGIDEQNCGEFLKAGAVGLGIGGKLINRVWITDGDFAQITELAAKMVHAAKAVE